METLPTLAAWSTFYQILGSAAGALTGLQFVTMALIADMPISPDETEAGDTFATPTVVHFGTVLFLAALLSVPWHGIAAPAALWGMAGLLGVLYLLNVIRRMRSQKAYKPVLEDWCFHILLPVVAYATLAASACTARLYPRLSLFAVAAAAMLMLLIGIHNSWDNVTYLVLRKRKHKSR